ncbi:hypothetical protein Nepgr_004006 [Nepenthes gracilis]|uniref:Uncharacterized protein n=1 Tax=Nepenthes gracilis TaxID=150966 RepID=A0AAD3S0S8_NEPGR|nr:hypothetical protein Nepgr_004006 [Nepenthes gracilis]
MGVLLSSEVRRMSLRPLSTWMLLPVPWWWFWPNEVEAMHISSSSGPNALFLANARVEDSLVTHLPVGTKASSLSASSRGLICSDVIAGSDLVGIDSVQFEAPPVKSADVVKPSDVSWSRVVQVGHSFCQPKKMYKATGRLLPIPSSIPSHSIKIPSSPKAVVKANGAVMPTSNSFEILSGEDDLSLLRKSATPVELLSAVEDLVGPNNSMLVVLG